MPKDPRKSLGLRDVSLQDHLFCKSRLPDFSFTVGRVQVPFHFGAVIISLHVLTYDYLLSSCITRSHASERVESLFECVQVAFDRLFNASQVRHYGVELIFEYKILEYHCCSGFVDSIFEGFQVKVNVRESDFVKNFIRNVLEVVPAPLQQRILQRYSFRTICSFLQKDFLEVL